MWELFKQIIRAFAECVVECVVNVILDRYEVKA